MTINPLKLLDLPPVWLIALMALASASTWFEPAWPEFIWPGRVLIALGVVLALWAAIEFYRAKTTIIPRERPSALVESGPFRFSRNPIYLADVLILIGWSLSHGLMATVVLSFALFQILEWRFIRREEEVLEADLGEPYTDYKKRVRRWI